VDRAATPAPEAPLAGATAGDRRAFRGNGLRDILNVLRPAGPSSRTHAQGDGRNSPLSMACAVDLIRRARGRDTIEGALELEYRFTARAMEHGDFLEGIRAAIIDKDRAALAA
jgi:enoyl-CoA hydratase